MIDETIDKEETSEESAGAWALDLQDASRWLEMLDHTERRYEEGEEALAAGKWKIALAAFEEVAEIDPQFRDVRRLLAQAREGDQLAHWYDEANAHKEAGRWAEACRVWSQVLQHRSDYDNDDALFGLLDALSGLLDQYADLQERLAQLGSEGEEDRPTVDDSA